MWAWNETAKFILRMHDFQAQKLRIRQKESPNLLGLGL